MKGKLQVKIALFLVLGLVLAACLFFSGFYFSQKQIQLKKITPTPTVSPPGLTMIATKILADPLSYKGKKVTIVGCLTPLRELEDFPPLSRNHWVIKDASGVIPVLGWPKSGFGSKTEPHDDYQKLLRLSGTVAIFYQTSKPYIVSEDIEELGGESVLPKREVEERSDCLDGSWQGVIKRCAESPLWNPRRCELSPYLLELEDGSESTFNDKDFENLEEIVGKKAILIGCAPEVINIMRGSYIHLTEIIVVD